MSKIRQTIIKSNWFDVQEGLEKQLTNKKPKTYGSIVSQEGEQKTRYESVGFFYFPRRARSLPREERFGEPKRDLKLKGGLPVAVRYHKL